MGKESPCEDDAAGAVLKAIQCVELASQGKVVHPRWGDRSYPDFFLQRCTQCKRCTEECPFGTLDEDEKGTPLPNITRCRRCGICMGACPERIVSFKDYSVEIISSMIKASEIPDEFEEKPRLLGLLCENDAYPALDIAGLQRLQHSAYIRFRLTPNVPTVATNQSLHVSQAHTFARNVLLAHPTEWRKYLAHVLFRDPASVVAHSEGRFVAVALGADLDLSGTAGIEIDDGVVQEITYDLLHRSPVGDHFG